MATRLAEHLLPGLRQSPELLSLVLEWLIGERPAGVPDEIYFKWWPILTRWGERPSKWKIADAPYLGRVFQTGLTKTPAPLVPVRMAWKTQHGVWDVTGRVVARNLPWQADHKGGQPMVALFVDEMNKVYTFRADRIVKCCYYIPF